MVIVLIVPIDSKRAWTFLPLVWCSLWLAREEGWIASEWEVDGWVVHAHASVWNWESYPGGGWMWAHTFLLRYCHHLITREEKSV